MDLDSWPPTWWTRPPLAAEAQSRKDQAGPQAAFLHPRGPCFCQPLGPPRRHAHPAAPGARWRAAGTPPHPQTLAPCSTDVQSPRLPLATAASAPQQHAAALCKLVARRGGEKTRQVGAHAASWPAVPEPSADAAPEAEARARSRACVRLVSFLYGLNSSQACTARYHTRRTKGQCNDCWQTPLRVLGLADV